MFCLCIPLRTLKANGHILNLTVSENNNNKKEEDITDEEDQEDLDVIGEDEDSDDIKGQIANLSSNYPSRPLPILPATAKVGEVSPGGQFLPAGLPNLPGLPSLPVPPAAHSNYIPGIPTGPHSPAAAAAAAAAVLTGAEPHNPFRFADFPFPGGLAAFRKLINLPI